MAVKTHDWDRAKWIAVEGARTNNLKNVSVLIPKHQITVLTGVSGSGKSSLAFGTIAAEAQRQVAETYPLFVRNRLPQGSSAHADRVDGLMFTTVVDQRPFTGNTRSTVGTASDIAPLIRLLFFPHRHSVRRILAGVLVQPSRRHVSRVRGAGIRR